MTVRTANDRAPSPPGQGGPGVAELAELGLVVLAVGQGLLLGAWLGGFPATVLRAGGFPAAAPFFVRWAGMFHAVLAVGYGLEWLRFRRVTLLVVAKGATALFLAVVWAADGLPPLLVVAFSLEVTLASAGVFLHGPADRSRRARARLRLVTPAPTQIRPAGQR